MKNRPRLARHLALAALILLPEMASANIFGRTIGRVIGRGAGGSAGRTGGRVAGGLADDAVRASADDVVRATLPRGTRNPISGGQLARNLPNATGVSTVRRSASDLARGSGGVVGFSGARTGAGGRLTNTYVHAADGSIWQMRRAGGNSSRWIRTQIAGPGGTPLRQAGAGLSDDVARAGTAGLADDVARASVGAGDDAAAAAVANGTRSGFVRRWGRRALYGAVGLGVAGGLWSIGNNVATNRSGSSAFTTYGPQPGNGAANGQGGSLPNNTGFGSAGQNGTYGTNGNSGAGAAFSGQYPATGQPGSNTPGGSVQYTATTAPGGKGSVGSGGQGHTVFSAYNQSPESFDGALVQPTQ